MLWSMIFGLLGTLFVFIAVAGLVVLEFRKFAGGIFILIIFALVAAIFCFATADQEHKKESAAYFKNRMNGSQK